jgi:hypothetical protein
VSLIVDTNKIPRDEPHLSDLFLPVQDASRIVEAKGTETVPVTLYYRTDDAYYVNKSGGPIIYLNHDAVDGVIFVQ